MPNRSTNFTPLLHVIWGGGRITHRPTIWVPRVRTYQPDAAEEDQRDVVNLLEESRDLSAGY
jgi:hypothetical protein